MDAAVDILSFVLGITKLLSIYIGYFYVSDDLLYFSIWCSCILIDIFLIIIFQLKFLNASDE